MRLTFYNTKTNEENAVEVPDTLESVITDNIIVFDHDSGAPSMFKIESMVPENIQNIRITQHEIVQKEFEGLKKQFGYTSEKDIPSDFLNVFSKAIDVIIQEKYPIFYKEISDRKEAVYASLSTAFVGYLLADIYSKKTTVEHSESTCYLIDYADYFCKMFEDIKLDDNVSINEFSEKLGKYTKEAEEDKRRHAGYSILMDQLKNVIEKLTIVFLPKDGKEINISKESEESKKVIKQQIEDIMKSAVSMYRSIPAYLQKTIDTFKTINSNISVACLAAICYLIQNIGKYIETFNAEYEKENDAVKKFELAQDCNNRINEMIATFETIVAIVDYLNLKDEYTEPIDKIWDKYIDSLKLKNNGMEWYLEFIHYCQTNWDELFAVLQKNNNEAKN